MRETKHRGPRLAAVLAATAVWGALAVGTAPDAAARPDAGGVRSCPEGSLATSATKTFTGTAGPGGQNVSSVTRNGELVGMACYQRNGDTATMQFRWNSVGRLHEGIFWYQLFDCTTGRTSDELTRNMSYETGTKGTSDQAEATVQVDPSRKYRMRIRGQGSYERPATNQFEGLAGYWSTAPTVAEKWDSQTTCA